MEDTYPINKFNLSFSLYLRTISLSWRTKQRQFIQRKVNLILALAMLSYKWKIRRLNRVFVIVFFVMLFIPTRSIKTIKNHISNLMETKLKSFQRKNGKFGKSNSLLNSNEHLSEFILTYSLLSMMENYIFLFNFSWFKYKIWDNHTKISLKLHITIINLIT